MPLLARTSLDVTLQLALERRPDWRAHADEAGAAAVADFTAANNAGDAGFGGGDVLFDDALACVAAAFCPRVFFDARFRV